MVKGRGVHAPRSLENQTLIAVVGFCSKSFWHSSLEQDPEDTRSDTWALEKGPLSLIWDPGRSHRELTGGCSEQPGPGIVLNQSRGRSVRDQALQWGQRPAGVTPAEGRPEAAGRREAWGRSNLQCVQFRQVLER